MIRSNSQLLIYKRISGSIFILMAIIKFTNKDYCAFGISVPIMLTQWDMSFDLFVILDCKLPF